MLRRQMERGNIVHSDIVTFQNFRKRWDYSSVGLISGALVASVWGKFIRRPPFTPGRLFALSTFAAFTGASLGTGFQVRALVQTVNSLEDPPRFKRAVGEMTQELVARRQAALKQVQSARIGTNAPQDGEHTQLAAGWDSGKLQQSRAQPAPDAPDATPNADRWAQLRAQKTPVQPTAWDTIRQTHERSKPDDKQDDNAIPESDAEKDRRRAQAEFDALLERERGFGQDNAREPKSRWSSK
ncbi:putative transmembrane protein [Rhizoctonia solani 123E]|uniref:Putative transmembrane protein n=1 Tax=Rhizoctonia solani 123E TaxID=1423351 RepID=A0A074SWM2_9AGAM|nr:putative transmembrane protein [Rhizoctonia solani 123E]